jgi:nucleoside-diphosphate-sugar epimerase
MRALVTGGAGFIGSNLAGRLLQLGHEVTILDSFATGRRENLGDLGEARLIEGDLNDADKLQQAMQGVEAVFHVAALPSVPRSWTDPVGSLLANAIGTGAVARAAREAGVSSLIYSSSSSVYGDQPGEARSEDNKPKPISPYACSKLLGEELVLAHSGAEMRVVALRYFNVFGPRQDPNSQYSAVIPKFISAARRGEPVVIHGDGKQSRDFTFVSNVVDANLLALESRASDVALNIACGESISLLRLVKSIEALSGRPMSVTHDAPRDGDIRHSRADISLAERLIGYRPAVDFETGLRLTFAHYTAD